jgi:hypothetical protein
MSRMKSWTSEHDHRLRMMAKAGWSVQMAAAQLERLPYDTETRAEVLGVKLADRTAGKQHDATRVAAGNAAEAVAASQVRKVPGDVLP